MPDYQRKLIAALNESRMDDEFNYPERVLTGANPYPSRHISRYADFPRISCYPRLSQVQMPRTSQAISPRSAEQRGNGRLS